MISLFVTNTDQTVTSNNGSKVQLSINPPIQLDPNKNIMHQLVKLTLLIAFLMY